MKISIYNNWDNLRETTLSKFADDAEVGEQMSRLEDIKDREAGWETSWTSKE